MEECYSAETRDVGVLVVQAQKGQGIGGSRAAHALGAERGWRQRCPVDAEEANTFILDDQDERESQALGASMHHKAEKALPWWAWIFIIGALGLAIIVGVAQVLEEHHKERVRLRSIKSGEGIEEARRAISRWTRSSSQMSEALRQISSPSSALHLPDSQSPSRHYSPSPQALRQISSPSSALHTQQSPSPSPHYSPSPKAAHAAHLPVFQPVFQVQPAMAYSAISPLMQSQAGNGGVSPVAARPASGGFSPMVQVSPAVYQAASSANTG